MLITDGTDLSIFSANEIADSYMQNRLVVINETPAEFDSSADPFISRKAEIVFDNIWIALSGLK